MSHPVTRAELREELAKYPTRDDLREELAKYPTRDDLREELAKYPTRDELRETIRAELTNYPTRDELRETIRAELTNYPTRDEMNHRFDRMHVELGRHVRSIEDTFRQSFGALDDKLTSMMERIDSKHTYRTRDLDARVTRLEAAVFAPKRRRSRR